MEEEYREHALQEHIVLSQPAFQLFTIDGTTINAHDVISKLKFIAKIEEGEKVATNRSSPHIVPDTKLNNWLRTFGISGGSANDTLDFVQTTTENGLELARRCFSSPDPFHNQIAHLIIESLKEADAGIQNIIKTYNDHRWFVSKVETFRQILAAKINALVLSTTSNV